MLKPAWLYKEQLQRAYVETWYNPRYIFYRYSGGDNVPQIFDNNDEYCQFVCVNDNDEVTGSFSYRYIREVRRLEQFGIISFIDGFNVRLIKDVQKHIIDLFKYNNLNGISWHCYTENPARKMYQSFIKKYGGREVGPLHQTNLLEDGRLHDYVIFEIMRSDILEKGIFI